MKQVLVKIGLLVITLTLILSCGQTSKNDADMPTESKAKTAKDILGNPDYLAMSYGGYRLKSREEQPTIEQLKEDMKILNAMGVHIVRTYNVHLPHAANLLEAIAQLNKEDENFEMYVMLGAWIDCEKAWTPEPNHYAGDSVKNAKEMEKTVRLANKYPEVVKMIAVGNEAMVKWAASYHVQADVILKWVNHLQDLKKNGGLPADMWITSSDNYASWGGAAAEYHKKSLEDLLKAVDFVSLHTYPMHETHYFPHFWGIFEGEEELSQEEQIEKAMIRAIDYAKAQVASTKAYMDSIGVDKPIHIGETGWATFSDGFYGDNGTKATDEYKEAVYYRLMRDWTNEEGMACFYFEAFNEIWKDEKNPLGSENHFGLFTLEGDAKYALWDLVDKGTFEGLGRNGKAIGKTYDGDKAKLLESIQMPPMKAKAAAEH